ncbi:hypothetical protein TSUD_63060 [Trifolium subterraneum]|uniref:Uncharacterized protein n=1 Tax=Trifolium subterraneum TaxID=3900 RepID=A0A2Z6NKW6_TRISU|nr:hypothetical protein TSUD_63060 [Trifolium subterraneum]
MPQTREDAAIIHITGLKESGKTQIRHHTTLANLHIDDESMDDNKRPGKHVEAWTA